MSSREREMDATSTLTAGQEVRLHVALHPVKYPAGTVATVLEMRHSAVRIVLSGGEEAEVFRGQVRPI